jgi:hypothetical protein
VKSFLNVFNENKELFQTMSGLTWEFDVQI